MEEGFHAEDVGSDEASITHRESGSSWSLFRIGGWLQVKGLIFEDVDANQALCLSLARLHSRLLGCRYGIAEDNHLWLHADVFPHDQTGRAVGEAITQMQAIVDSTYNLLVWVQQNGIVADDAAIDEAFQLKGDAALH